MMQGKGMQRPWIPALVLLVLLVAFRCLGAAFPVDLANFQPLPALLLCSVIFLRGAKAWSIPVAAWLISYPLASLLQGYSPFEYLQGSVIAFATLLLTGVLALPLRRMATPALVLSGGVLAAVLFHAVTNTAEWLIQPLYAKTSTGFWQALWTGLPEAPVPTWVFLRNMVLANALFTGLFLMARRQWTTSTLPSASPALAKVQTR